MKYKFLLATLIIILSACSKPLPENKLNYEGEWQSKEMSLLIRRDGTVSYQRLKNGTTTSVQGPIKHFEGNNFVVGLGPITTTFEVNQIPKNRDGKWTMTVDGVQLKRIEE